METFSALLAICAGNSPVPGEFPTQRPVTRSFDVYFDLRLNKSLCKQSWGWWFETLLCQLWRHSNETRGVFERLPSKLTFTKRHCIFLLVVEILCSSTKVTIVLMMSAWRLFHVFGGVYLCIIQDHTFILNIGFVCVYFELSRREHEDFSNTR